MGFASKIAASQNQMRAGDAPGGVPASLQAGNSNAPSGGTPYPASVQTPQGKPAAYVSSVLSFLVALSSCSPYCHFLLRWNIDSTLVFPSPPSQFIMYRPYDQQGYYRSQNPPASTQPSQSYQPYTPSPAGGAPRPGAPVSQQPPSSQSYQPYSTQQPAYSQSPQGYGRPPPPPPQGQYSQQQAPYGHSYPQQGPPPPAGSPYPPGPPGPVGARPPGPPAPPGPPRPPGAQYGPPGGAAPATPQQVASYRQLLISTIQEKQLQHFYPQDKLESLVQSLAVDAPAKINKLMHEWNVSIEIAMDVIKLSLFDVILYVDDSGSIEFEEGGVRKDQLRQIITTVATAASTFDQDGISVRFMNSVEVGDGIRSADDVNRLVSRVRFQGLTPLGTNLRNKVLDPLVVGPARSGRLQKPILIITITDGQPAGEPRDTVAEVIRYSSEEVSRTPYGRGAVSFQFSQVGNDTRAREFLASLDEDPRIGGLIDCTSNFEVEQDEMSRANPPVYLTRELWCAKLMLGAIDSSYDTKDEKAAGRADGAAPPPSSQYGGYPQAPSYSQPGGQPGYPSYGQPAGQPGYGQGYGGSPPQTNYGQAYGGYGAQSYQPSYPAYGGAPAGGQGGYPPQQQQQPPYGAPPAPPRY